MKQFLTKNLAVVLAFAFPIILILVVAATVFVPSFLFKAEYDFVYATCEDGGGYYYNCDHVLEISYTVDNERLVVQPAPPSDSDDPLIRDNPPKTHLFLHDTARNENREITAAEAQKLTLNGLLTSPDGVTLSSGYSSSGGLLFFGSGSYEQYLSKGDRRRNVNLLIPDSSYSYSGDYRFIGWVLSQSN